MATQRFPISFGRVFAVFSSILLMPPAAAYLELAGERVSVRMSWAFRCTFPRASVRAAAAIDDDTFSRGVHGLNGRWLVNGAARGLVRITLAPTQRAWVMGVPVALSELTVSVAEPAALVAALQG